MKRFCFRLCVAILAFGVGVTLTYCSRVFRPSLAERAVGKHVRLTLQRVEERGERREMQFRVVNGGPEPLRYRSYGKDDHCAFFFWSPNGAVRRVSCFCGTGLAERTLHPGEEATFRVGLDRGPGEVRVGFDFLVGEGRREEITWSEFISLR